jgi:hypothetical protein
MVALLKRQIVSSRQTSELQCYLLPAYATFSESSSAPREGLVCTLHEEAPRPENSDPLKTESSLFISKMPNSYFITKIY